MPKTKAEREPQGFGEHTRKRAGENAHEQGWGLNEDERRRRPAGKQNSDGGKDYEYGARDFGDEAVDTAAGVPGGELGKTKGGDGKRPAGAQRTSARRG